MRFHLSRCLPALILPVLVLGAPHAAAALTVVTSTADLAALAREVGGPDVTVEALITGRQDPHYITPRPSLALTLQAADALVHVGLELELAWLPQLVERARNRRIAPGAPGDIDASAGIAALELPPPGTDRSQGDLHRLGNPHYWLDPLNALTIAQTLAERLARLDPDHAGGYRTRAADFRARLDAACFGPALVEIAGGPALERRWADGTLREFLRARSFEGKPLAERLAGWAGRMAPVARRAFVAFHKTWSYFARRFDLEVVDYVEPQPGVQPSRRHLEDLITTMRARQVGLIVQAHFYDSRATDLVAKSVPARVELLPVSVGGADGLETYFDLLDRLVARFAAALAPPAGE